MFLLYSGTITFGEYSPLYLKQLGLSASQVGLSTLMGLPLLFVPLAGYLGDRFRARKLVLLISIVILILQALAPLLNPLFTTLQNCNSPSNVQLINQTNDHCNQTFCLKKVFDGIWKTTSSMSTNKSSLPSFAHENLTIQIVQSNRTAKPLKRNTNSLWSSLFLYVILTRGFYEIFKSTALSLFNLATMTHIKTERGNYGSYYCWGQIGASLSLFAVGIIASQIKNSICGGIEYGYFVTFPWAAFTVTMSLFTLPWISFEYLEHRVIKWRDVKSVVFETHYLVLLFIGFYFGWCLSFQYYWEYWYIYELSGSPVVMGICGLIRRPLTAIWFRLSGSVIERLGDIQTMAVALLVFGASQFTLSLIEIPWFVLVIDIFQSVGYSFSYSALNVHFSKAGSKASSAVILGKKMARLTLEFSKSSFQEKE